MYFCIRKYKMIKVSGVIEEVKLVVINLRFRELKRTSVFPFADTIVLRKAHNFHFYSHFYSHFYFRKLSYMIFRMEPLPRNACARR